MRKPRSQAIQDTYECHLNITPRQNCNQTNKGALKNYQTKRKKMTQHVLSAVSYRAFDLLNKLYSEENVSIFI